MLLLQTFTIIFIWTKIVCMIYHLFLFTFVKVRGDAKINVIILGSNPLPGIFWKLYLHVRFPCIPYTQFIESE